MVETSRDDFAGAVIVPRGEGLVVETSRDDVAGAVIVPKGEVVATSPSPLGRVPEGRERSLACLTSPRGLDRVSARCSRRGGRLLSCSRG